MNTEASHDKEVAVEVVVEGQKQQLKSKQGITRLTYTHDAMVDLILQEPTVTHAELAEVFGYSASWIQRVVGSDAFAARLAERKAALIDPHIARSLNERLRGVTIQALDIVGNKLSAEQSAGYALEVLGVSTAGLSRKVSNAQK